VVQQRRELEVAERRCHPQVRGGREPLAQPGRLQARPRARVQRQHGGLGQRLQQRDEALEARGVVDVAGPVGGHEQERAGLHAVRVEHLRAGGRARAEQQRDVDHDVADDLDPPRDPLGAKVLG
jgi:hypothetical protein